MRAGPFRASSRIAPASADPQPFPGRLVPDAPRREEGRVFLMSSDFEAVHPAECISRGRPPSGPLRSPCPDGRPVREPSRRSISSGTSPLVSPQAATMMSVLASRGCGSIPALGQQYFLPMSQRPDRAEPFLAGDLDGAGRAVLFPPQVTATRYAGHRALQGAAHRVLFRLDSRM